ncbi:MAG: hypothetical protein ACXVW2_10800 [Nocardioidaceae bacterium]
MFSSRPLRRAAVLSGAAVLAASLTTSVPIPAQGQELPTSPGGSAAGSHPTNAGKVYRWGLSQWHDGFTERLRRAWAVNHRRQVDNQHGMLTINGTAAAHNVSATYTGHARRYGRWETRVRAQQYGAGHTPYRVVAELIPAGSGYHCGGRSIVLATYKLGAGRARMHIRNRPRTQFTYGKRRDLRAGHFHTYAVEVTKRHISWFVDAHVAMTERRPAARTGLEYKVRFRLVAKKGARMNPGRMQMDWIRYYTMHRHNAHSIAAPRAHRGTYRHAC